MTSSLEKGDKVDFLPLVLFWLLIMGLATFGVMMIGLALISWVVERSGEK